MEGKGKVGSVVHRLDLDGEEPNVFCANSLLVRRQGLRGLRKNSTFARAVGSAG